VQLIAEAESTLHLTNILKHEAAHAGASDSAKAADAEKHADTQASIAPSGALPRHSAPNAPAEASQKADSPARYHSYSMHKLIVFA
jgi:hypothetical protein